MNGIVKLQSWQGKLIRIRMLFFKTIRLKGEIEWKYVELQS